MTFRLPQKVNKVTLIDIRYPHANQEKQSSFLLTWQDWLKDADQRVTLISRIYNDLMEGLAIIARGIFYGPPEVALGIIAPLLELGGVKYSLKYVTFLEAVTIIGDFYPPFEAFKSASRFAVRDFSSCESFNIAGLIKERAEGSVYASISFYAWEAGWRRWMWMKPRFSSAMPTLLSGLTPYLKTIDAKMLPG